MKAKLVGVQGIHFTNNSGEEVNGTKIYCAFYDDNVEGLRTADFFLKDGITLPKETKLNDTIDISFNMKGNINICRNKWWNSHLNLVNRKAVYQYVCPGCKKEFSVYGNGNRKYYTHECYIKDRFGGGSNE